MCSKKRMKINCVYLRLTDGNICGTKAIGVGLGSGATACTNGTIAVILSMKNVKVNYAFMQVDLIH